MNSVDGYYEALWDGRNLVFAMVVVLPRQADRPVTFCVGVRRYS